MTAPSMAYIEAPDMGSLTAAEYRRAMATAGARRDTQVSSSWRRSLERRRAGRRQSRFPDIPLRREDESMKRQERY